MTSVTIPNSVTNIGNYAFWSGSGLTSINVGGGNAHYASVGGVLFNKAMTMLIQYPAGRSGTYAIPNTVTSIGIGGFAGCINLTSVTIPDSVTSIGDYAFESCSGLTSVTIPDSVTNIGNGAFSYCPYLTIITANGANANYTNVGGVFFNKAMTTLMQCPVSLTGSYAIPDTVTNIADSAFASCSGLTSVTIPDSVTSIGDRAFVIMFRPDERDDSRQRHQHRRLCVCILFRPEECGRLVTASPASAMLRSPLVLAWRVLQFPTVSPTSAMMRSVIVSA